MITNIIAVYPGRFQPFGKHHAAAFLWLQKQFGKSNSYIVTSDKVDLPKSPLSFKEKKSLIDMYGFGNKLIKVKNPYKAEELLGKFDPETTAVIFMVGEKDMSEDPRFKIGKLKSGADSYFQKYEKNEELEGFDKHGYLLVAPHISLNVPGYGEMSGTQIRKALGDSQKSTQEKEKLFKGIFGWYSKKLADYIIDKFTDMPKTESVLTKEWWSKVVNGIITEGGAAGHMQHMFDVDSIKTGKDLITGFEKSIKYLEKGTGALKIDGVNASVRLATIDGKKQFVLDRGSNKPLDVKGITKKDLLDRFGEGHGMIVIGGKVLDVFNAALPKIKTELQTLGMWDNPNIMFNVEYVSGSTNVLSYDKNFLAIHGLLEIAQVTDKRRATKEINYSDKVLESLIQKMIPIAAKQKFSVFGSIPTTFESKPNLNSVLNKSYTIQVTKDKAITKTLKSLLSNLKIPKDVSIDWNGKRRGAISKEVFTSILNGEPVAENTKQIKEAIDGFTTYLATMELGDEVLKSMTSPLGSVENQEGVVIRDSSLSSNPVKITGKFIVKGLESGFRK